MREKKRKQGGPHTAGDLRDRRPTPKNEIAHLLSVSAFVLFFLFFLFFPEKLTN